MGRKAKIRATKKQKECSVKEKFSEQCSKVPKAHTLADELNQHLCTLGILSKGEDGKCKATKALVEGYIPGWLYDIEKKVAYMIGQENGLKIKLDFDVKNVEEQVNDRYLKIESIKQQARLYLEKGNILEFQKIRDKLKKNQPYSKEADIYVNLGCQLFTRGNYHKAIINFNQAMWLNPYHALAYYNRGVIYSRTRNYQRAIEDFNISIELDPGDADAYDERGLAFLGNGQEQAAIQDFNRAIIINANHPNAHLNRGGAFSRIGNYQIAIQDFNKAIELNSHDADAYYNRAIAYRFLGYYKEALNDFDKSAIFYEKQGRLKDFDDAFNQINKISKIENIEIDKESSKIIVFENEEVKINSNRVVIEVNVSYLNENNEQKWQIFDVVLLKNGIPYE